jgi:hypothetical protein
MYRSRVPEIFLGCFLTIAIFATGMLFVRPYANQPAHQVGSTATQHDSKEKQPEGDPSGWDWLFKDAAGFFTFGLVAVGVGQAILFFIQLRYMRSGMEDAGTAANAAKESADTAKIQAEVARDTLHTMQETAKRQLRAYVAVCEVRILYADGEWQPNIRVTYQNYGQTPASSVENRIHYFFHTAAEGAPVFNELRQKNPKMYLAPSQDRTTSVLIPQANWNLFKEAVAKKGVVFFVYGEIHYTDAFGDVHWTKYRLQLDPDDEGIKEDSFTFCAEGNDAH